MSNMIEITRVQKLNIWECSACHIPVCLTPDHEAQLRMHGGTFYCPSGHSQSWHGNTEVDRLRKALHATTLEKERAEKLARDSQEAKRIAETMEQRHKGELTRLKSRAAAGVCPCCNRTFKQLAAHMKNKHPDAGEVVRTRLKAAKPLFSKGQLDAAAKHPTPRHLFQGADVKNPKVD